MRNMTKVVVAVALLLMLVACSKPTQSPSSGTNPQQTTTEQTSEQGRAVMTVTDAAENMSGVTSVKVTVDSVQVHQEGQDWVTTSSDQQTFDLLQLKAEGSQSLLADAKLAPGNYSEMRLMISKVIV